MDDFQETIAVVSSSTLPRSAKRCRIPKLNRSTSVKLRNDAPRIEPRPKSLTLWPAIMSQSLCDSVASVPLSVDDNSSLCSFASYNSGSRPASSTRNHYGKRYVLHCDRHLAASRPEDYLTPTQRKDREIRQLKAALNRQAKAVEEKDLEIERLNERIGELEAALEKLKLEKLMMTSSQDSTSLTAKHSSACGYSSDVSSCGHSDENANANVTDDSGISNALSVSISPRHSSEFEDLLRHNPLVTFDKSVGTEDEECDLQVAASSSSSALSKEFGAFLSTYKFELEEVKSQHKEHYEDLRDRFNERVDDLLRKLTEANTRYMELRPLFERAQTKIDNIESQLTEVQRDIESQECQQNHKINSSRKSPDPSVEALDFTQHPPRLVPVSELLRNLQADLEAARQEAAGDRQAEYTLRFLKDAVFYFLTKRDKDHLKAIQSILGFSEAERAAVVKAAKSRRLFRSPFKFKK